MRSIESLNDALHVHSNITDNSHGIVAGQNLGQYLPGMKDGVPCDRLSGVPCLCVCVCTFKEMVVAAIPTIVEDLNYTRYHSARVLTEFPALVQLSG